MRYLVACIPLLLLAGCAAVKAAGKGFEESGGVEAVASAVSSAAPLIPGIWGKIIGLAVPPLMGLASKSARGDSPEVASDLPAGVSA